MKWCLKWCKFRAPITGCMMCWTGQVNCTICFLSHADLLLPLVYKCKLWSEHICGLDWHCSIWGRRVLCFERRRWDIGETIRELWNRLDFLGFKIELMTFLSLIFLRGVLKNGDTSPMERCGSSCCRRIVINIIHHCSGEQNFVQYWWTDHALLYLLANCGIT